MQVDEKALKYAYDAGRDYVMDMDDRTKQMIRVCVRAYLSALGEQKPIAFVSKRVIDALDVNGTEIVDAMLFPRGTLRPTEARPLYASPLPVMPITDEDAVRRFKLGSRVTKTKGSSWTGRVVGFYSTTLTPIGYAVESENEPGSVQIYPEAALDAAGGRG